MPLKPCTLSRTHSAAFVFTALDGLALTNAGLQMTELRCASRHVHNQSSPPQGGLWCVLPAEVTWPLSQDAPHALAEKPAGSTNTVQRSQKLYGMIKRVAHVQHNQPKVGYKYSAATTEGQALSMQHWQKMTLCWAALLHTGPSRRLLLRGWAFKA